MRDRQVGLGAVLAPQCRNATPPLVTASAAHALRRHALTYPAIADMSLRQRIPAAGFTLPIQAARARNARVQAAIDSGSSQGTDPRATRVVTFVSVNLGIQSWHDVRFD
jgi:hypothetical protein